MLLYSSVFLLHMPHPPVTFITEALICKLIMYDHGINVHNLLNLYGMHVLMFLQTNETIFIKTPIH